VLDLARSELLGRKPYQTADSSRDYVRLHANESPWSRDEHKLNRYPSPQPRELSERLAEIHKVDPTWLMATRGSDDGIDLLIRAFCRAGADRITICPPTFGMYSSFAQIQDASIVTIPLLGDSFELDLEGLCNPEANSKLVFVCRPNNPTGSVAGLDDIETLARRLKGRSLVVVDEAYIEFSDQPSAIGLVSAHENIVILRTLSKAYGMAGLRCGAVVAHPEVIRLLSSISAPYAMPSPCVKLALASLTPERLQDTQAQIRTIKSQKIMLTESLGQLRCVSRIWPSEANFLLIRFQDAQLALRILQEQGILVRDFSQTLKLENCLRVTLGTQAENKQVISLLRSIS
ncbi:MAG: histidinol-phosphate transaminase, partial [Pseudomonadota bacterium]